MKTTRTASASRDIQQSTPAARPRLALDLPLIIVLLIGLALRLLLWDAIPRTGFISDEGEYFSAATWLAQGRGFDWYQGYLWTRAPLYPLFLAAHLRIFGATLTPIFVTQTILSLVNVVLVYLLAGRLGAGGWGLVAGRGGVGGTGRRGDKETRRSQNDPQTTDNRQQTTGNEQRTTDNRQRTTNQWLPTLAALMMAVYYPFILYTQTLLSETLFITLLLGGFLALAGEGRGTEDGGRRTEDRGRSDHIIVSSHHLVISSSCHLVILSTAGVLFGLATLTRSLTLGFIPLVALWLLFRRPTTDDRRPTNDGGQTTDDGGRRTGDEGRGTKDGGQRTKDGGRRTNDESVQTFKRSNAQTLKRSLMFLISAILIILPWTVYNSRLYGGLVLVDTSGAFNLVLGAHTAAAGERQDAWTRDFVLSMFEGSRAIAPTDTCAPPPGPQPSQAARQAAMTREGLCLVTKYPVAFVAKSLSEFVDLFQINYGGDERFTDGFTTGRLPVWHVLATFVFDDTLYVFVLPLAVIGWALAWQDGGRRTEDGRGDGETRRQGDKETRRQNDLRFTIYDFAPSPLLPYSPTPLLPIIILWWLYNLAVAPLLFAINRFRLPLLPFAFIFAAYALVMLSRKEWRWLRSPQGVALSVVAALLALVATAPYAYVFAEPRSAALASYLGPFPSSVDSTGRALVSQGAYARTQQFRQALAEGDAAAAEAILRSGELAITRAGGKSVEVSQLAEAILDAHTGRFDAGLARLPTTEAIIRAGDVEAAVVRGDMLRSVGKLDEARILFGGSAATNLFVDAANPAQWAWDWLRPVSIKRIDLAGDLDLGYIEGCYLGEGDAEGTFRWCTDGARLRFPAAGTGAAQHLALRIDGRGRPQDMLPIPPIQVFVAAGEQLLPSDGAITPVYGTLDEYVVTLPPVPTGADVIITLHTPTFVADAARYLSQQGAQVGQPQRLGARIDWAELRERAP
jgi:hypothetical protein